MASLTDGINELKLGNKGGGEVPTNVAHRNELATCKIRTLTGWGSGTLIKIKNMFCVLTNNHVLPAEEIANGSKAHFEDLQGVQTTVQICPDQFFVTDVELDFTVVAVARQPTYEKISKRRGKSTIVEVGFEHVEINSSRVNIGATLQIVQHPRGGAKKISIGSVVKLSDDKQFVFYNFDTDYGSSGSPVFMDGNLVALHHQRSRQDKANRGVLMTAILLKLNSLVSGAAKKAPRGGGQGRNSSSTRHVGGGGSGGGSRNRQRSARGQTVSTDICIVMFNSI